MTITMPQALWTLATIWSAAAWLTALILLVRWVIRRAR